MCVYVCVRLEHRIHYRNYWWQPVMTPACYVSTELASAEGQGSHTVACIHSHSVYLCVRRCHRHPPHIQLKLFASVSEFVLCFFILPANVCIWVGWWSPAAIRINICVQVETTVPTLQWSQLWNKPWLAFSKRNSSVFCTCNGPSVCMFN